MGIDWEHKNVWSEDPDYMDPLSKRLQGIDTERK